MPWLLAYAHALQHMDEAADRGMWQPSGVCFIAQISLLVDVFIQETGAELVEADIASCWGQMLEEVPCQKDEWPFMEVISHLDELAWERHGMSPYSHPLQLNPVHPTRVDILGILWAAPWTWGAHYLPCSSASAAQMVNSSV